MNELEILNEINKIGLKEIEQAEEEGHTKDIYWFSNEIPKGTSVKFNGTNITEYYENNEYGKKTRWNLWNDCILCMKNDINAKMVLDIGGANGHLSFLSLKNGIESYTIEPRVDMIKSTENEFLENFGNKKVYCGNINIFLNTIEKHIDSIDFKFDCITILNFLHGINHDANDIARLVELLPKITKHIIVSDPNFKALNLKNLFDNFEFIKYIGYDNLHKLYKIK